MRGGGQRGLAGGVGVLVAAWILLGLARVAAGAEPAADTPGAVRLIGFEGQVEVLTRGAVAWSRPATNTVLAPGDRIRTGPDGRALIRSAPGNLVRLRAGSLLEVKGASRAGGLLNLILGFFHFFDREGAEEVDIRDGLASAASLGTDFAVAVDETGRTDLGVFDGQVTLRNAAGSVTLTAGRVGQALPGLPPTEPPGLSPDALVQWTWYYPIVVDPADLPLTDGETRTLAGSIAAYRSGSVYEALRLWPAEPPASDAARVLFAALRLAVGESGPALELSPAATRLPAAAALGELIRATASGLLAPSTPADTSAAPASVWLARSYTRQAARDLPGAREAAREARQLAPGFGPAWAREAELLFGEGRLSGAGEAVDQALTRSPGLAPAWTLKGFIRAGENRIAEAIEAFDTALAHDSAHSPAWLGRGLARIRRGDLAGGRDDLRLAAALEPRRALLRSYLGKALQDSGRLDEARHELGLARDIDPGDPTSWLYSALAAQGGNRVNEAIRLLETSEDRNDRRALYRSELLLDQDRAVRAANLARIYQDAGLDAVAVREAIHAVADDYANYSAHLFLANSFSALRDPNLFGLRYDTPAFSEYLLANLLSPVGAGTLSPLVSQAEYGKLFERDRLGLVTDAEYLSRGAWTVAASQFGTFGNSAYALEGFYRSDPGQWTNGDVEQRDLALQWKQQITPADQVWLRVSDHASEGGDLFPRQDPSTANPLARVERDQSPVALLGFQHTWAPGVHTLFLAGRQRDDLSLDDPLNESLVVARFDGVPGSARDLGFTHVFANDLVQYGLELQQLWKAGDFDTVAGVAWRDGELDAHSVLNDPEELGGLFDDPAAFLDTTEDLGRVGVYLYETWSPIRSLRLTAGLAYDRQEFPINPRHAPLGPGTDTSEYLLPKAGFQWQPWRGGVLRGAYAQTASSGGFNPALQLEPTQVAGFIQSYRSVIPETLGDTPAGSRIEIAGLALDQRLPGGTYLGVALDWIRNRAPLRAGTFYADFDAFGDLADLIRPGDTGLSQEYEERAVTFTVDQLLGDWFTVGVSYRCQWARLDSGLPELAGVPDYPTSARHEAVLHQVAPHVHFNHPSGVFGVLDARWRGQDNRADDAALEDESVWQVDVWAGYRLPRRRAEFAVGILNLFDDDYRLNPLNTFPAGVRERTLALRVGLRF